MWRKQIKERPVTQQSGDLGSRLSATRKRCDLGQVNAAFHLLVLILLFKKNNEGV